MRCVEQLKFSITTPFNFTDATAKFSSDRHSRLKIIRGSAVSIISLHHFLHKNPSPQPTMAPSQEGVVVRHARREGWFTPPPLLSFQQLIMPRRCPHNPPTDPRARRLRERVQCRRGDSRIPPQHPCLRTLWPRLPIQYDALYWRFNLTFSSRTLPSALHALWRSSRNGALFL